MKEIISMMFYVLELMIVTIVKIYQIYLKKLLKVLLILEEVYYLDMILYAL